MTVALTRPARRGGMSLATRRFPPLLAGFRSMVRGYPPIFSARFWFVRRLKPCPYRSVNVEI